MAQRRECRIPARPGQRRAGSGGAEYGSPVILSTSITLQPGETSEVGAERFRPPIGQAVEIHEARFMLRSVGAISGAAVGGKFTLGARLFTNSYVPLNVLGRVSTPYDEEQGQDTVGTTLYNAPSAVWKFDKPLIVQPGETVIPTFQHFGMGGEAITVYVAYVGRTMRPFKPASRAFPYVASWTSDSVAMATGGLVRSNEHDLANKTGFPLNAKRFVGRVLIDGDDLRLEDSVAAALTKVTMRDSWGHLLISEKTPFRTAFAAMTRAWECPHVVPIDAHYLTEVEFEVDAASTVTAQAQISLAGYWEEVGQS
jgi:hypothetical protein